MSIKNGWQSGNNGRYLPISQYHRVLWMGSTNPILVRFKVDGWWDTISWGSLLKFHPAAMENPGHVEKKICIICMYIHSMDRIGVRVSVCSILCTQQTFQHLSLSTNLSLALMLWRQTFNAPGGLRSRQARRVSKLQGVFSGFTVRNFYHHQSWSTLLTSLLTTLLSIEKARIAGACRGESVQEWAMNP